LTSEVLTKLHDRRSLLTTSNRNSYS